MQTPSDREDVLARAARGELLGPMDIAAIWSIGPSRFNALNQQGKFDRFKVTHAIGPRCFSGAKLHRYLQGEVIDDEPVFGRKRRQA